MSKLFTAGEFSFRELYHAYMTIEADDLTEKLKDRIEIHEDDCYTVCTTYCSEDGSLRFAVLSVGSSWQKCMRGIDEDTIFGSFSLAEVRDREMVLMKPNPRILRKGSAFLARIDRDTDEDIRQFRLDPRLDAIRDIEFPDIVYVGVIEDSQIMEYDMCLKGADGPFISGVMVDAVPGHKENDNVMALPYIAGDTVRLLAIFIGEKPNKEEKDIMDRIREISQEFGISFNGITIRS